MKRFVTSYRKADGHNYSGHVDALDFEHAKMLCDQRGRGETVDGILYTVIQATERFGNEQADAMCKAFADSGDDEPPDAEAFAGMDSMFETPGA